VVVTYLILTKGNGQIGAGTIQTVITSGTKVPGWLECDGSEYDPEDYPELHKTLTGIRAIYAKRSFWQRLFRRPPQIVRYETYGIYGENRLPDLRGRIVR